MALALAAQPECQTHTILIANQLNPPDYSKMCGFDARPVRKINHDRPKKFIEAKAAFVEKFSHPQTKKLHSYKPPTHMHYLTIAWRKLISEKGYSLLYVAGLALGLGVVLLDGLWIHDELRFNKYHKHYDRIAQVMHHDTFNGQRLTMPWSPAIMGDLLRNEYGSEFKQVIMSTYPGAHVLTLDKKNLSFQGAYMDQGAPSMLSLEMLEGTKTH
jgi:hypothetical protein